MINVHCSDSYRPEREYIIDVLLNDFLGLEYKIIYEFRHDICFENDGKKLFINDSFFQQDKDKYLKLESLPAQPLDVWQVQDNALAELFVERKLPVIYGRRLSNNEFLSLDGNELHIGIDILGSAFFMLTRYEEVAKSERDNRGRFSAKDSLAYQEGFLERPIINEYLELLWWGVLKLWPDLHSRERDFRLVPTHDVDRPSVLLGFIQENHWRRFAGDILYRKDIMAFFRRWRIAWDIYHYGFKGEWKYIYDYIMDISESYGVKSTFYFMTPAGLSEYDGDYCIEHLEIVELIRHIHDRGHKIGLHPSYASFQQKGIIKDNAKRLQNVLEGLNIEMAFGGRQHYLRWEPVTTWQEYEDAGLAYDSSLSFADHIGFRCGVCYEYPCFNLATREKLNLRELPLIIMEGTAFDYMGLSGEQVISRALRLKEICRRYKGDFVMLWHNDKFIESVARKAYDAIMQG